MPRGIALGALLPLILAVLLAGTAPAQWVMPSVASVEASLQPNAARRGETITLRIKAAIDEGYHLYGIKQPSAQPGPTATKITLSEESASLLRPIGQWNEPQSTIKIDPGFEFEVSYLYGSPLEFTREFAVNPDQQPGEYTVSGTFLYQACTETSCLPPMTEEWTAAFTITEGEPLEAAPAADGTSEDIVSGSTFGAFIITAFALGLLALLTPCVFPMIPITITFFTGKAAKSTAHAAGNAAVYVLSIILGFTIIGFGFSLLLRIFQAGVESSGFAYVIAANPWINLFFGALYIIFALSLFGIFEFQLPSGLSQKMNMKAMKGSGILSIFFKAMVFVVISFTCTAPLLGVLIVQAIGGEWTRPLFGMMAFSTGFAAPFFFLALAPQMLGHLPRAGSWLYAIKVVMGLVVFAAAFKFLSNSDLIWLGERMFFTREVLLAIWTAFAAVTAFYLFGFIHLKGDDENRIGPVRMIFATAFSVFALYLASGLFGGRLHLWVEAYMPPDLRPSATTSASGGGTHEKELFDWHDTVEPALAEARAEGKNVFIDFSGYTCTNCRLMEKTMFPRPEVVELLQQYVLVRVYTDDPETGKQWQGYQARMFNTVTLPLYAIMTPDEEIIAKAEYTRNVDKFVRFLRSGLGKQVAEAE